jgi:hypothetical protein
LEHEPDGALGVRVQAEGVHVTRVLRDVAGEDGDEEGGCCAADHGAGRLLPCPEQSGAEGELDNA